MGQLDINARSISSALTILSRDKTESGRRALEEMRGSLNAMMDYYVAAYNSPQEIAEARQQANDVQDYQYRVMEIDQKLGMKLDDSIRALATLNSQCKMAGVVSGCVDYDKLNGYAAANKHIVGDAIIDFCSDWTEKANAASKGREQIRQNQEKLQNVVEEKGLSTGSEPESPDNVLE